MTIRERFNAKYIVKDMGWQTPCWIWTAACNRKGYAVFWVDGKRYYAARWILEQQLGRRLKSGNVPDHLCRMTACVNVNHLEEVTTQTNILRGEGIAAKNHFKLECKSGHPLSGDNLYIWGKNYRACRKCKYESWIKHKQKYYERYRIVHRDRERARRAKECHV